MNIKFIVLKRVSVLHVLHSQVLLGILLWRLCEDEFCYSKLCIILRNTLITIRFDQQMIILYYS